MKLKFILPCHIVLLKKEIENLPVFFISSGDSYSHTNSILSAWNMSKMFREVNLCCCEPDRIFLMTKFSVKFQKSSTELMEDSTAYLFL